MEDISGNRTGWQAWSAKEADHARDRYAVHRTRLAEQAPETQADQAHSETADTTRGESATPKAIDEENRKKSMVQAALARAQAMKAKAIGQKN